MSIGQSLRNALREIASALEARGSAHHEAVAAAASSLEAQLDGASPADADASGTDLVEQLFAGGSAAPEPPAPPAAAEPAAPPPAETPVAAVPEPEPAEVPAAAPEAAPEPVTEVPAAVEEPAGEQEPAAGL